MSSSSSTPHASTSTSGSSANAHTPATVPHTKGMTAITEQIKEGEIDTTETSARYLALLGRIRPVLLPATRYLAYTSDIGEAFRPIINRKVVTGAYGVSIAYVAGDIGFEGYKAHLDRKERLAAGGEETCSASTEIGLRVARRTVFQGLASIILPAVTIHSAVKYSAPLFLKSNSPRIKGWGPTVVGLAIVPALPIMFDHPVETLTDKTFDWVEENWIGSTAEAHGRRRKAEHGKSEL